MSEQRTYTAAERERIEELVSAYVLGALADDDTAFREFDALLAAGDSYLAETLETMLEASSLLAMTAPQVDAPASVKVDLLESIKHIKNDTHTRGRGRSGGIIGDQEAAVVSVIETKLKKRTRLLLSVSVVALLAIAVLGGLVIEKNAFIISRNVAVNSLIKQRDSLGTVAGRLAQSDSVSRMMFAMFHEKNSSIITLAKTQDPQPLTHQIFFSREQKMVFVMREDLPQLDSSKVYEVWQIKGTQAPMAVGMLDMKSDQPVFAFTSPDKDADAFAISIEPQGGSTSPRGPVIMVGKVSKGL